MTEFNKGDIVYPTAEHQASNAEVVAQDKGIPDYRDEYVASGKPFRIVGQTTPIASPIPGIIPDFPPFLVVVPVDSAREEFNESDFIDGDPADYADVFLMLPDEVQHDGGVLAGV